MKWSFMLGRFSGIDVYLHFTFLLVLGFLGFSRGLSTRHPVMILDAALFFALLFLCILLHGYGHALAARRYGVLSHDITLCPIGGVARAVSLLLAGSQADFPVVRQGTVAGILTRNGLIEALAKAGPAESVGQVMRRDFVAVEPDTRLEHLLQESDLQSPPPLPVVQHGRSVGSLTMGNIGELVNIRSAWGQRHNAATA